MSDLYVDAIGTAVHRYTRYLPLTAFGAELLPRARAVAASVGIPLEFLTVVSPEDAADSDEPDVSALALAALGEPTEEQPLFLVRSGPLRDAMVAALARLVHEADWAGDDLGITHLDELGGTAIFELLSWAILAGTRATVVICDEPTYADARAGGADFTAVGLRVRRGGGALRVLGCGEGPPPALGEPHRIAGARACDGWLALHEALAAGRIADGERILLHTKGSAREGWLWLAAVEVARLRLAGVPQQELVGGRPG